MSIDDKELEEFMSLFVSDCRAYISSMTEELAILEKEHDNKRVIDEIFRYFHSIKGAAGYLKFYNFGDMAHKFENLLSEVRNGKIVIDEAILSRMFRVVDIAEKIVDFIESNGKDPAIEEIEEMSQGEYGSLIEYIDGVAQSKVKKKRAARKSETAKESLKGNETVISLKLQNDTIMKTVRLFVIYNKISEITKIKKSTPTLAKIKDGSDTEIDSIKIYVDFDSDIQLLENILKSEIEIEKYLIEEKKETVQPEIKENKADGTAEIKESKTEEKLKIKEYIRVEREKIDDMMDAAGELVIDKNGYMQLKSRLEDFYTEIIKSGICKNELKELGAIIESFTVLNRSLERDSSRIQYGVTTMRMVPVREMFAKLKRSIKETADKVNKEVEVEISGEETELDKMIMENLGDPLIHMVRNSIDHGIEKSEIRDERGKSRAGKLKISAENIGSEIVICVEDDGNGIDYEKLAKKCLDNGKITNEEYSKMGEDDKIKLIFMPGSSTAEKITDISGRGVGMDVVKTNIEKIKGKIEVKSKVGEGSKFIIKLPMTLSIKKALLVKGGDSIYSIAIENVAATIKTERENIEKINGKEMFLFRDKVIPVIDLKKSLGENYTEESESREKFVNMVIIKENGEEYGVTVEGFIGQQEIVIKNIEGDYHRGKGVIGATILGDGRVAMVVDVKEMIEIGLE